MNGLLPSMVVKWTLSDEDGAEQIPDICSVTPVVPVSQVAIRVSDIQKTSVGPSIIRCLDFA